MSTHNLCFGAKIKKKCTPRFIYIYYIKVWCKGNTFHRLIILMVLIHFMVSVNSAEHEIYATFKYCA